MFHIRLATMDDEEEVMKLYKDHYEETFNLFKKWRNVRRFFSKDKEIELYLCIEDETNKIVGAVTHRYLIENGKLNARSNCGLTHKDYRRKGLSKMRRNFALERYWSKGVEVAVRARKWGTRPINIKKENTRGWTCEDVGRFVIMRANPKTLKLED